MNFMNSRVIWTLFAAPLLVSLPVFAQTVLHDAESPDGWSKGAVLVQEAQVGKNAVRFSLPAGSAGPSVNLQNAPDFSKGGELSFWYRFSGTGSSNLMIKIVAAPLAGGMQAVWNVAPQREADNQWHRAIVDLGTPFLSWGEKPDLTSKQIIFRTEASTDKVTLDLDQITLAPKKFDAKIISSQIVNGIWKAQIEVANNSNAPLTLDVDGQQIPLDAGARHNHEIALPFEAQNTRPLQILGQPIRVFIAGDANSMKQIEATVTPPLNLPPHPRLLLSDGELGGIKARLKEPQLKARYETLLKDADAALAKPLNLPSRGGQWYHWYACKKDGNRLKAISPTQHKCDVCGTIYSGYPYDDVYLSTIHDAYSRDMKNLGLAYRLSGDKKYAAKARELLLAYADKYESYPLHDINGKPNVGGGKIGPQTLDESTWTIPVAQGADLIWDTLSEADKTHIGNDLFRPIAQVIRQHKMSIHNIQCWKNSAVGLVGLLLDDAALVAEAINGEVGFKKQIEKGISADGQWYEGAWGYHFYTMNATLPLAEAGARCGLGLYEYKAPNGRSYKDLFEGPLNFAMPNLLLPAFNDSGTVDVKPQQALYETAFERYGDPRFAEVLKYGKRDSLEALLLGAKPLPEAPVESSAAKNYAATGYAILRNSTGENATWLCLKYGPHGGGHGHPDKLNFVLYSRGQILGVDPGTAAYGVPIQNEWYKSTLAHNTLVVDEENQKPAEGKSLAFLSRPGLSAALAEAGNIYEGVVYRRAVALFGEDTILILDIAKADKEHTFDFAYHNAGKWETPPNGEPVNLPNKPGYQHFQDATKILTVPPIIADNLNVRINTTAAPMGQLIAGTGVGKNTTDRVPMLMQRIKGTQAVAGWLIHLDKPENNTFASGLSLSQNEERIEVAADVNGQKYRLTIAPDADEKLKVE